MAIKGQHWGPGGDEIVLYLDCVSVSFLGVLYGNAQEVFCRLSVNIHGST